MYHRIEKGKQTRVLFCLFLRESCKTHNSAGLCYSIWCDLAKDAFDVVVVVVIVCALFENSLNDSVERATTTAKVK